MILFAFLPVEKVSQMSVFFLKRDSLAKKQEIGCERYIDYQWFTMYLKRVFSQIYFFI